MNRQRALQAYISTLAAGATLVVLASVLAVIFSPLPNGWTVAEVGLLLPLGWLTASRKVYISGSSTMVMASILQVATIMLLPVPLAVLTIGATKVLGTVAPLRGQRARLRAIVVNISNTVVTNGAAALAFTVLGGPQFIFKHDPLVSLRALPALLVLAVVHYTVNNLAVSIAVVLDSRERLRSVLSLVATSTVLPELSQMAVGVVFATLWHFSPLLSAFIIFPVFLSIDSFENVARLRDQTEKAIQHLVKSIDMRDTGTGVHSQHLEQAAYRLASAVGLLPETAQEIALAARAHDLGKIEISDSILLKRGPLSPEERTVMQEHPVIGAQMLAGYAAFDKSVQFVKHHHERWDGRGYPDGLKGEDIPIGARIIAVVDSYDAMTADRPYRKSLGVAEAVSRLKADMGTQFDPRICAAWIQILIEDGTYVPPETAPHLHLVNAEASVSSEAG